MITAPQQQQQQKLHQRPLPSSTNTSSSSSNNNNNTNGNAGDHLFPHEPQNKSPQSATSSSNASNSSSPGTNSSPRSRAENGQHHNSNNYNNNSNRTSNGHNQRNFQSFEMSPRNSYDYDNNDTDDDSSAARKRPSNEHLLGTAFCTFMGFALVQTVVAVFAKSEAMLGDSAAMIVDAMTYLFNWFAERKKAQFDDRRHQDNWTHSSPIESTNEDPERRERILARTKRKKVLQLELIPPLISVSTLVVVTAVILHQAIKVLVLDVHRSVSKQGNPNILIMIYFSIANLGLDLVNVANFAKAKHLFGYETNEKTPEGHSALSTQESDTDYDGDDRNISSSGSYELGQGHYSRPRSEHSKSHDDEDDDDAREDQDHTANLNMCSAYTHVFADTLRSIAVLMAACISELVEEVTPEEADASAAVVVSGLILLSLIPLCNGLYHTSNELRMIRAEEKSESLLFTSFIE